MGVLAVADNEDSDRQAIIAGLPQDHPFSEVREFEGEASLQSYLATLDSESDDKLPCLFIIDLQMESNESGQNLLQAIRASKTLQHIPILIASVSDRKKVIKQLYAQGANSFIAKPDKPADISKHFARVFAYWGAVVRMP